MDRPDHEVAIVGGGFSGLGAAAMLDRAGFRDWTLFEQGDDVGGAWHWNTYPGVAVDIPSFSYQFSFETNPDWSRVYAPGSELKQYARHLVDRYGLAGRIRLRTRVAATAYDDTADLWRITTAAGDEVSARHVIGATGVFTQPKPPDIPGVESFAGQVMHTARWDHGADLAGKRVAVIGTGASAVQAIPEIAKVAEHLTVFQRTPIWCLPKPDAPLAAPLRWAMRNVPGALRAARAVSQVYVELTFPLAAHFPGVIPSAKAGEKLARKALEQQVRDPAVREQLTPRYALGCKRPSFSNEYLPAFNRSDVTLETTSIDAITAAGVRTADGVEHPVDVLVLATGFKVFERGNIPPYEVIGPHGESLDDKWENERFHAYQGVSVPGFPNAFTILGPYGYNGSSYFALIESQMGHIIRCLEEARRRGATRIEVTAEATERYVEKMRGRIEHTVFAQESCATANSYYFDKNGDVPFRASPTLEVMWTSSRFPLTDYRFSCGARESIGVGSAA